MRRGALWLPMALVLALAVALSPRTCPAAQLLINPGFEIANPGQAALVPSINQSSCFNSPTPWNYWTYHTMCDPSNTKLGSGFYNSYTLTWGGGKTARTGVGAVRAFHYGGCLAGWDPGWRTTSSDQTVAVVPNQDYTASAWIYFWLKAGQAFDAGSYAKVVAYELDASGSVVASHEQALVAEADCNKWTQLSAAFRTTASTTHVKFSLEQHWLPCHLNAHPTWDDCSLEGPIPSPITIQGTVWGGGSPLPGATVEIPGLTPVTAGPGGAYQLQISPSFIQATVRASNDGYFAQRKVRNVVSGNTYTVDFDLAPVGGNIVTNAGFDDNAAHTSSAAPDVWSLTTPEAFLKESAFLDASMPAFFRSGEEAVALLSDNPPQTPTLSQGIPVLPNSPYVASVWARAAEGSSWGVNQRGALWVRQINRGGEVIDDHYEYQTNFSDWQKLSWSFTSLPSCAQIRIGVTATMTEKWSDTLARVVFDDVELLGTKGPAWPTLWGTVKEGTTPITGAAVAIVGSATSTTSDVDGTWSMNPVAGAYWVRASAPGYYPQQKRITAPGQIWFNMVPINPANLIAQPGFDDDPYLGWWEEFAPASPGLRRGEQRFYLYSAVGAPQVSSSGFEAMSLFNARATPGEMFYYQDVAVVGGQSYTAAAKVMTHAATGQTDALWGTSGDDQTAGLLIKEYDAAGNLLLAHPLVAAQETGAWETLTTSFTANASAAYVKIGGYCWMVSNGAAPLWSRASFDDLELIGPRGSYGLSGTVTSGGSPVPGAVVELSVVDGSTSTYTTGGTGGYTATVPYGAQCRIVVSAPGFYSQWADATITRMRDVSFDLLPANLMFCAGFDAGAGWTGSATLTLTTEQAGVNSWYAAPQWYSKSDALSFRNTGEGRDYQDVPVLPNASYTGSALVMAATDPRYPSVWGTDATQVAGVFAQELDANKNPIGSEVKALAPVTTSNLNTWLVAGPLSLVTSPTTAYVRFGGYAKIVDAYGSTLARAVMDNFVLTGPAAGVDISAAKSKANGSEVVVRGKVVTASFPGYFYIQEADRSSGIRVSGAAQAGDVVDVKGAMTTIGGAEKAISASSVLAQSKSAVPESLGSHQDGLQIGLSPVGLYMRVWGRVDSVNSEQGWFTITDGSKSSLKVYGSAAQSTFVVVTGALGAEMNGSVVVPVLRSVAVAVDPE